MVIIGIDYVNMSFCSCLVEDREEVLDDDECVRIICNFHNINHFDEVLVVDGNSIRNIQPEDWFR